MKRDLLVISILLLLAGVVWQGPKAHSYYRARRFWKEFLVVNSAWLTPNPPAMTYEITYSPQRDEFPAVMETWYSPGGNVRNLSSTTGLRQYDQKDERYANGKGAVQHYEKEDFTPELKMADRIRAQTGHPFFTALHVLAVNGLPWQTNMEDRGETVVLRCHGYREGDMWFQTSEDCDMEVIIDRQTKLPIRMKEYQEGLISGYTVATHFASWLRLNGKPVPGLLECSDWGRQVDYRFQVVHGVWIGKDMVCKSRYGPSPRTEKAVICDLKIGPIPKGMFVGKEVYVPRPMRWHGTPSTRLWNSNEPILRPSPWLDTRGRVEDSMLEHFYSEREGRTETPDLPLRASDLRAPKPARP